MDQLSSSGPSEITPLDRETFISQLVSRLIDRLFNLGRLSDFPPMSRETLIDRLIEMNRTDDRAPLDREAVIDRLINMDRSSTPYDRTVFVDRLIHRLIDMNRPNEPPPLDQVEVFINRATEMSRQGGLAILTWDDLTGRTAPPETAEIQSYDALLKQLYGIPVELPPSLNLNGLEIPVISFSELPALRIVGFRLDPLLQPWAGPPSSPNRIITLILQDGRSALIKARYDADRNELHPPN